MGGTPRRVRQHHDPAQRPDCRAASSAIRKSLPRRGRVSTNTSPIPRVSAPTCAARCWATSPCRPIAGLGRLRQMAKTAAPRWSARDLYHLLGAAQDEALMQRHKLWRCRASSGDHRAQHAASRPTRHPEAALDFAITHWDKISKMLEATSAPQFVPRLATTARELSKRSTSSIPSRTPTRRRTRGRNTCSPPRGSLLGKVRATRLPEVDRWLAANPVQLRATASMLLPSGSSTNAP